MAKRKRKPTKSQPVRRYGPPCTCKTCGKIALATDNASYPYAWESPDGTVVMWLAGPMVQIRVLHEGVWLEREITAYRALNSYQAGYAVRLGAAGEGMVEPGDMVVGFNACALAIRNAKAAARA